MPKKAFVFGLHKVIPIVVLSLCLISVTNSAQAKPPYRVIAYLSTGYVSNTRGAELFPANIPWSYLTSIYAFQATVHTDATVSYTPLAAYSSLVSTAHSNNMRVYLTFGGANSDSDFGPATNSPTNIPILVSNIMSLVNTYGFDGVDIDWEYPSGPEETQFMSFMQQLSGALKAQNAFDGNPMGFDFFTSAEDNNCGVSWTTIGTYVDNAIISGYSLGTMLGSIDYDAPINVPPGGPNAFDCEGIPEPQSIAGNVALISGLGFSKSQMILGCPLYIANGPNTDIYSVIQNSTSSSYMATEMESIYNDYPNNSADDSTAYCNKISWALAQGMPGIALFELSQACPYTDSPVTALWGAISDTLGCVTLPTPTFTATTTSTATATPTNTPCFVGGVPCTSTATPTATNTPTITPTVLGVTVPLVYPNPTSGQPVNLRLPIKQVSDVTVQIFTLAFRKVWQQEFPQVAPTTPLSVPLSDASGTQLANGLYYIVAVTSQGTYKTKLLILR